MLLAMLLLPATSLLLLLLATLLLLQLLLQLMLPLLLRLLLVLNATSCACKTQNEALLKQEVTFNLLSARLSATFSVYQYQYHIKGRLLYRS